MTLSEGFVPWPEACAAQYRALGVWTDDTLSSVLRDLGDRYAMRTAVVDRHGRQTFAQLRWRAERLATGLSRLGIGEGDAVVVQLPNRTAFVEVLFALACLGAVPVMAQPAHRRLELSHFARKSGAVAHVVVDRIGGFDFRALSRELRAECPSVRHTLVIGEAGDDVSLETLYAPEVQLPALQGDSESIALFQLSGGSTNVPKLIARSHADYLYSVRQSNQVCGFDASTVYLAVLPVAHNFPLSSPGALGVLLAGGTLVLCDSPAASDAFEWIAREKVSVAALVPALLPSWLRCAARKREKLASLQLLQVGGARLVEGLAERIEPELDCRLQQVFGMAEGLVCYTRPDDAPALRLCSQGRPMSPHDELRVVDEADRDVPVGELGQLLVRGPYTIRGYYAAAAYNREAFTPDGYYRTGDLVRRDAEGNLVVEGRAKDQINRGGEKVAAPEVEAQLCSHPDVEMAALVAMPDAFLGERSCAFVVRLGEVDAKALRTHLEAAGLAAYKLPDRFEWAQELPRTAVGKIDKQALRAQAAALASSSMGAPAGVGATREADQ